MARRSRDIYDETVAVFDRSEPLTTPEVADALDANRRTVYKRLEKLVERGELETKETGANSRVWWRPPDGSADLLDAIPDGALVHDPEDGTIRDANEPFCELVGSERAELLGKNVGTVHAEVAPDTDDSVAAYLKRAMTEGPQRFECLERRTDGETVPVEIRLKRTTIDGAARLLSVVRERTDRTGREEDLRATRRFNEELVENGPFGMFRLDEELRITYENPRAREIVGLPDEEESEAIGVDIRELPSIVETGKADIFTRLQDGETIEFEFPFESIYGKEAYFTGRGVPLYRDGEFDGAVLMAKDISERRQRERELERRREQLAALNELNDVVRGITDAVIAQSTRAEIERVVCDRLSDSGSYQSAWICAVDSTLQLEPRVGSGIGDHLDDIAIGANADGDGPVETAVRTQEGQVVRDALDQFEPWGEYADENGFDSLAVLPIVHQDTLYGVLGVWSERADAFTEEEREVVGQLGEIVGHAIAAVNRKRALMSDEITEFAIRIPGLLQSQNISEMGDGAITVERTVPLGGDDYLLYGAADESAMTMVETLDERLPSWTSLRRIDEIDGQIRFEQRLSDPPITSVVADLGGYVERGRIENGEYGATIHLPPGTAVRRVLTEIRETYPSAECLSQQQRTREEATPQELLSVLAEELTERQRAALEAGYYAGFFQWPRESSGEEVADSLDVGASTFHQHVRKAEKKLLDRLFESV